MDGRTSPAMTQMEMPPTVGLVLAGGLARRMGGGDKALIQIGGVAILDRVLDRLRGACAAIVLNANGDPARFARYGLPVVADSIPDYAGPLAGILAGLDWAAAQYAGDAMAGERAGRLSVPAARPGGAAARRSRRAEYAASLRALGRVAPPGRRPVAGRPARGSAPRHYGRWPAQDRNLDRPSRHCDCPWPDQPFDPFFNVNTPEDAATADRVAKQHMPSLTCGSLRRAFCLFPINMQRCSWGHWEMTSCAPFWRLAS